MSESSIRFSPNILKRLGEELNPNPDQGILELVKNAYDADADECIIEMIGIDKHGGKIVITDDGYGMTSGELADNWLVLGKSEKDKTIRTRKGRNPVGSKGLGRLSALRLGKYISLETIKKGAHKKQYSLTINWDDYLSVDTVEDVKIDIALKQLNKNRRNGTRVEINNVAHKFSENEIKRLARQLVLLADPFDMDKSGFHPVLRVDAFKELEDLVSKKYFSSADYHLVAEVDSAGISKAVAYDWKGEALFEGSHEVIAIKRKLERYLCPAAKFEFWIYILDSTRFSVKETSIAEVRKWLSHFNGVHVYENRIRVTPYGDSGNDWLGINLLRTGNPEERPSTDTSIGRIIIDDPAGLLVQKTDRSGFIQNESFDELRRFAVDSMEWLASRRLEQRDRRRRKERAEAEKRKSKSQVRLEKVISESEAPNKVELVKAFTAYQKSTEKEIQTLRKDVQLYRTLSTAGITAATFAHESGGNPLKVLNSSINTVKRRLKRHVKAESIKEFEPALERIRSSLDGLSVLGSFTLSLLDHLKRRPGKVSIHSVITGIVTTFSPFVINRQVFIELNLADGEPYLNGSRAAVESIITNLINNSLTSFEQSKTKSRTIYISTKIDDDAHLSIIVSDNGNGISDIDIKDIWLPGRSTRENGTGLGLTIVKDAVTDLSGDVAAQAKGIHGGASFVIRLPIIGS